MEECEDFSLSGKAAVTEANLRDEYYWKLVADFIGPQSGEGLDLGLGPCKNRLLIQVGLLREDNNFPWLAILNWLKKIFPRHHSADFRPLIERGIATTLSLGREARLSFLESDANFSFVGPICDSIGVEREHLLELRDFRERAQSIEVTNGLMLELTNFIAREKVAPVVLVTWLRNFEPMFCQDGNVQRDYKILKPKIKKFKLFCHSYGTRSSRRNAAMENLLRTPFELVEKKFKFLGKKHLKRDDATCDKVTAKDAGYDEVVIKEEDEDFEITQGDGAQLSRGPVSDGENEPGETGDEKGDVATLLDITMLSVQKLTKMYGGKTEACKQVSFDLLRNQYILTCKEHPAMVEFEDNVRSLCEDGVLVSPVAFLNCNANFLVEVHDAVERQIATFEKEIVHTREQKLGRDQLPKFRSFVNLSESATSRFIHMARDLLSSRSHAAQDYRKHWVAFCKEMKNPSRVAASESNRFNSYFEAAAGLVHHHKEIAPFLADMLSLDTDQCPNVVLESVAADANDSVIQSLVCVLAVVYCKVLGPYWQLLKSGAEYSLFSTYLLYLYQKFLDWSKDPSTLLEPEETTNAFLQRPLQERTFDGVFQYCGRWHTNRDLIRACLKRVIKAIAAVTGEHLKDFLPGGAFSKAPSPETSSRLAGCTFSVLMAEYPFGPASKKRPSRGSSDRNRSAGSSEEDEDPSDSSDSSLDESPQEKKCKTIKKEKELQPVEGNMDSEYIAAMVRRNGGPCKTQQDVDKMMVRFDGKSRAEKKEGLRCEIAYQTTVLNNADPHLQEVFYYSSQMLQKLKLSLPRVKPGFSLVWAPRKTKIKPKPPPPPHT